MIYGKVLFKNFYMELMIKVALLKGFFSISITELHYAIIKDYKKKVNKLVITILMLSLSCSKYTIRASESV